MAPKPILVKTTEPSKSILFTPSRVVSRPDNLEGGEETEIAAQISVPQDGGWGWVVLASAFISIFILDGVAFTFGSLLNDMSLDLKITTSLLPLVNSISVAIYFIAGPLASAFINRFGFRACIMSGSIISAFSLLTSYFSTNFTSLCVFYGCFAGFGYCLINMAACLIVGFYFEKLRSLALAIATTGSSFGVMIMSPVNTYLSNLAGWRTTTLFHSGLFGLIFFIGMTFQPLLSLTVMKTTDDPTRTVTYLPNLSTAGLKSHTKSKTEGLVPTATERLFGAASNLNFPTAAAVVDDSVHGTTSQPGPSTAAVSKLTLTANTPQAGISPRQLKQVQSIISKPNLNDKNKKAVELTVNIESSKTTGCCGRLCQWDEHIPQSRPMYRDDAFYEGKLEKLPAYQKSMLETPTEGKTGLEYQLAVSRAATAVDLRERRGVFTTAARRVLATMMGPKLLKKKSFLCLCMAGLLVYVGFLVPYVYIQMRNEMEGIPAKDCSLFVSVIGLSNAAGRIILGAIACKMEPVNLFSISMLIAGASTILSNFSFTLYAQYLYCFLFGFFISCMASLRSTIIVSIYGLDNLTNATGIMLLFQGLGSLFSTPLAGVLKDFFGFSAAFINAGAFIILGGLIILPIKKFAREERDKETNTSRNK
ncbi:monocarboxylate transporter 7-like [Leptidea sinapis]|uniref:monocarboxylate transporter 7-like n=1 Tax=Leptidea sinapis TaxID=189913 RepID=UPI0021C455F2|nr:monocarboxylate transporter 7-like [Leptidea sinapis]